MLLGNIAVRSGKAIDYNPETGEIAEQPGGQQVSEVVFPQGVGNLSDGSVGDRGGLFSGMGQGRRTGRVRRAFSLFAGIWKMIELQIRHEHPGISDGEAAWLRPSGCTSRTPRLNGCWIVWKGQSMAIEPDFQETTERIVRLLAELGVRFHFTGGIVAAFYGDPRSTQDLDIVIDLQSRSTRNQRAAGATRCTDYLDHRRGRQNAIAQKGLFQAIDERSMIKIDFHVGEKIPGELSRSTRARSLLD